MASHVIVVDTSFRRASVKVTPGMYLIDIMQAACQKFNVQSSMFDLKHNKKSLDLSITFRQSGLKSGTILELVLSSKSPTPVLVALQLPDALASLAPNGRLIEKFSNDTSLWMILRKFESIAGPNVNFTARGIMQSGQEVIKSSQEEIRPGQIFYEMPVLNLLGRVILKIDDFQNSLRQLGIFNGTCLIKLEFKKSNQLLEDAKIQIQNFFKGENPIMLENRDYARSPSHNTPMAQEISRSPNLKSNEQTNKPLDVTAGETLKPTLVQTHNSEVIRSQALNPDERLIAVYAPPSGEKPKAATIHHDETDFEPTVEHAKLHQSRLQNSSQNKRLPSDAELERLTQERLGRLGNLPQISIKIRFPDQSSVVCSFKAEETGETLYAFTANLIAEEHRPFNLIWHNPGPQKIPKVDKRLVHDLGFQNRMLVNFSWEEGINQHQRFPILKSKYAQNAKELVVENNTSSGSLESVESFERTESNKNFHKKVPGKWLKGIFKK